MLWHLWPVHDQKIVTKAVIYKCDTLQSSRSSFVIVFQMTQSSRFFGISCVPLLLVSFLRNFIRFWWNSSFFLFLILPPFLCARFMQVTSPYHPAGPHSGNLSSASLSVEASPPTTCHRWDCGQHITLKAGKTAEKCREERAFFALLLQSRKKNLGKNMNNKIK